MKKLLLFVLSCILFSGCAGGGRENEVLDAQENIVYHVGKVTSLGSVKQKSGVGYLLSKEDGKTILVKSSQVNLASEKYNGQLVEIAGVEFLTEDGKTALEVRNVDVIEKSINKEVNEVLNKEKNLINEFGGLKFSVWKDAETRIEGGKLIVSSKGFKFLLTVLDYRNLEEFGKKYWDKKFVKGVNPEGVSMLKWLGNIDDARFYFEGEKGVVEFKLEFDGDVKNKNEVLNKFIEFVNGVSSDVQKKKVEVVDGITKDENVSAVVVDEVNDETLAEKDEMQSYVLSEGFEIFSSDGFNFKVAYPKNLFFESASTSDPSVMRSYAFGVKEADKFSQVITLDLMKTKLPSGSTMDYGNNKVVKVSDGENLILYVQQGDGGRVYRLRGKSRDESKLVEMARSLGEAKE